MDSTLNFFLPTWASNLLFAIITIIFISLLIYVLSAKHLSFSEKVLLIIAIFALPLLGAILAVYYGYSRKNRKEVYGKTLSS